MHLSPPTFTAHLILLDLIARHLVRIQIIKLLIMQSSPENKLENYQALV
jgi:hypothetical protein